MTGPRSLGRRIWLAALWAVTGAFIAAIIWAALGAILYGPTAGWAAAFAFAFYFAGFVALLAVPFYTAGFAIWTAWVARRPTLEGTPLRIALSSLALAAPAVLAVLLSYVSPWSTFGPSYQDALDVAPIALVSVWLGVLLPRLALPALDPRPKRGAA